MPFLEANGINTYYEVHGEGPPLLLISGNGMDHTAFKAQVPAFSKHFQCIVYDFRGIGKSAVPDPDYDARDMATDALAVLTALDIETAHVAGYSLGGCIGQELAIEAPSRVKSLSLYSSLDRVEPYLRRRYDLLIKILMEGTPELWAMYTAFTAFGEDYINTHDQEIEAEIALRAARWQGPEAPSKQGLLGHYRALMSHDASDRLDRIGCPTWIAVGSVDPVTPPSYARRLHEAIAGSELVIFDGGPHRLLTFQADEFTAKALDFLLRQR